MSNLPPAKLFSLTKGKSLLCLIISSSGKQGIAISDKAAEAVRDVTLKENITADALRRLVKYFEVRPGPKRARACRPALLTYARIVEKNKYTVVDYRK